MKGATAWVAASRVGWWECPRNAYNVRDRRLVVNVSDCLDRRSSWIYVLIHDCDVAGCVRRADQPFLVCASDNRINVEPADWRTKGIGGKRYELHLGPCLPRLNGTRGEREDTGWLIRWIYPSDAGLGGEKGSLP